MSLDRINGILPSNKQQSETVVEGEAHAAQNLSAGDF